MNGYLGYGVTQIGKGGWRIKAPSGNLIKWYMTEKQALVGLAKLIREFEGHPAWTVK